MENYHWLNNLEKFNTTIKIKRHNFEKFNAMKKLIDAILRS
jgi:hypothetical protein